VTPERRSHRRKPRPPAAELVDRVELTDGPLERRERAKRIEAYEARAAARLRLFPLDWPGAPIARAWSPWSLAGLGRIGAPRPGRPESEETATGG
jgi:hypothetical protein